MSSPSYAPPVALKPGEIQFYDNFPPILDPGQYTIKLTQTVKVVKGTTPDGFPSEPFAASPTFKVVGGGLSFDSGEVYSVYPPDNSTGLYDTILPNVVLSARTLPWEVTLEGQDSTVPWMALLLFAPNELQVPAGQPGQPVTAPLVPLSRASASGNGVLPVTPPPGEFAGDPTVRIIEVPTATFTQLVPYTTTPAEPGSPPELSFLAHCRQVNTGNQEMLGMDTGDAWFSVVVGNRFPKLPQASAPVVFTAHLVSLYGLEEYLNGAPAWPQEMTAVRLISLYTWSFTCQAEIGGSFETLMTNVASGVNWLSLPVKATAQTGVAANVQNILQQGYVPVGWTTRTGDQITSWYRGPLCPSQAPRLTLTPIHSAAEATVFDAPPPGSGTRASGMFDQSYAVAWETGRLLALADKSFAASLMKWRKQAQVILNKINATPALVKALSNPADVQELRNLLDTQILDGTYQQTNFLNTLLTDFARHVAPGVTVPANVPLPAAANAPSPPPQDTPALTAILRDATVRQALADMNADQFESICVWLANLTLLQGVPFANLVADPRMLPPESARFFYLDQTYTDVMIDGALCAGIQTSFDVAFNDLMRDVIRDAVDGTVTQLRSTLLTEAGEPQTVSGAMAGFLLRSSVVSGYPGLQVIGHVKTGKLPGDNTAPVVPLLRMVSLAPGVLFCLFSGDPDWVEITMPHAGLRFGTEENGDIALRYISGDNPGAQPQGEPTVPAKCRTGTNVLDIRATVPSIKLSQIDPSGAATILTPAGFALQMIDSPERAIFVLPEQPSLPATRQ